MIPIYQMGRLKTLFNGSFYISLLLLLLIYCDNTCELLELVMSCVSGFGKLCQMTNLYFSLVNLLLGRLIDLICLHSDFSRAMLVLTWW